MSCTFCRSVLLLSLLFLRDLIEADDIDMKTVEDFIGSLLVKEEIVQFTKCNQPDESLKERLWSA